MVPPALWVAEECDCHEREESGRAARGRMGGGHVRARAARDAARRGEAVHSQAAAALPRRPLAAWLARPCPRPCRLVAVLLAGTCLSCANGMPAVADGGNGGAAFGVPGGGGGTDSTTAAGGAGGGSSFSRAGGGGG